MQDPLELQLQTIARTQHECLELNSSPLQEQQVFFISDPSFQPYYLLNSRQCELELEKQNWYLRRCKFGVKCGLMASLGDHSNFPESLKLPEFLNLCTP